MRYFKYFVSIQRNQLQAWYMMNSKTFFKMFTKCKEQMTFLNNVKNADTRFSPRGNRYIL